MALFCQELFTITYLLKRPPSFCVRMEGGRRSGNGNGDVRENQNPNVSLKPLFGQKSLPVQTLATMTAREEEKGVHKNDQ